MSLEHYCFYSFICRYENTCGTVALCINKTDLERETFISRKRAGCANQRDHQQCADSESFLDDFSGHYKSIMCIKQKITTCINMIHVYLCNILFDLNRIKENAEKIYYGWQKTCY